MSQNDTIEKCKGHCPKCGSNRNANVIGTATEQWDDKIQVSKTESYDLYGYETYRLLKCCGCDTAYIQREAWFSEGDDAVITHWPSPARRQRPNWLTDLNDTTLRCLLEEVYGALDADFRVLAAIGARTVLDRTMVLNGAEESSMFPQKLAKLQEKNVLSEHEKELLEPLINAGSAAAHRAWKPTSDQLNTIMSVIEGFVHRILVQQEAVDALKKHVTEKTKRAKK